MDYVPTPYQQSRWEGIDSFSVDARFECLPLEVLISEDFQRDPMFEVFDEPLPAGGFQQIPQIKEEEIVCQQLSDEDKELLKQEGYELGFIDGKLEGKKIAEQEVLSKYEELAARISNINASINSDVSRRISDLEQKAVGLALDISRKIISTTAEVKPDYIFEIVKKGISQMGTFSDINVYVGKEDFEFLSVVGLPDSGEIDLTKINYILDEKITSGCRIEGSKGILNLELEHMWNEIKQNLFSAVQE